MFLVTDNTKNVGAGKRDPQTELHNLIITRFVQIIFGQQVLGNTQQRAQLRSTRYLKAHPINVSYLPGVLMVVDFVAPEHFS